MLELFDNPRTTATTYVLNLLWYSREMITYIQIPYTTRTPQKLKIHVNINTICEGKGVKPPFVVLEAARPAYSGPSR